MKKKRLSREVKIGIYGVSMLLLLYLGVNYIKSQDLFSRDNTFYAVYDNSDGIEASSPVTIKGFRVGTVDKVWYDIKTGKVVAEFSVKGAYPLPANSEAKITSASLLGAKVIDLQLGNSPNHLEDGDTIKSAIDPGLMKLATTEYDKLKQMATTLVEQISTALAGVNAVLSDQNVANLSAVLANANSISAGLDNMVKGDLTKTAADLRVLSGSLRESAPKINNIVDKVNVMADSMSTSVPVLMAGAAEAVGRLNVALAAVNDGKGSAGKLINDKELYDNLAEASESLTLLLQDVKQNPGRYIHFSVFGGGTKNKDRAAGQKSKE